MDGLKFSIFGVIAVCCNFLYGQEYDGACSPRISIITSVYNGDEYIRHFLEDITQQSIFNQCELLMINANSPGNEEPVILEYMKKFPNIFYTKLEEDPGLYGVWNLGVSQARADYVTNANLDDRLASNCYQMHADYLDNHPNLDLVYSDCYRVSVKNMNFQEAKNASEFIVKHREFSNENMSECLPNNHPMWRKKLHEKYGFFDETYKSASDWEMWLRAVQNGAVFGKVGSDPLAVFYWNESSGLSHSSGHELEVISIKGKYKYLWGDIDSKDEIYLITSLYNELDNARRQEYITCLEKNITNNNIKEIHILYDISKDDDSNILYNDIKKLQEIFQNKITVENIIGRPSYKYLFDYANKFFTHRIVLVCNGDVYFDGSLELVKEIDLENTVIALTRWNIREHLEPKMQEYTMLDRTLSPCYMSFDSWIFRTPFFSKQENNILLGTWQCDSLVVLNLLRDGFRVINPCLDIKMYHLHMSEKRNYVQNYVTDVYECPEIPGLDSNSFKNKAHPDSSVLPRVSMLLPIYGTDINVENALKNILTDSFFNQIELLIFYINPKENTSKIIQELVKFHNNVKYSEFQTDPGLASILNAAIRKSKSEYICLAKIQCSYAKNWFEILRRHLERNTDINVVCGLYYKAGFESSNFYDYCLNSKRYIPNFPNEDLYEPFVWKKSLHDQYGYFDEMASENFYVDFWRKAQAAGLKSKGYEKVLGAYYDPGLCQENSLIIKPQNINLIDNEKDFANYNDGKRNSKKKNLRKKDQQGKKRKWLSVRVSKKR